MSTPAIPEDLVKQIAEGDCVVFVGAGLSQGAGLPGWAGLLRQMMFWAQDRGVNIDREEIEHYIDEGKLLLVAEEMTERLGKEQFGEFMVRVFRDPGLKPTNVHKLLPRIPFAAALTTNYDTLLESAYAAENGMIPPVYTHSQPAELTKALRSETFYILKTHGTVDNIETIIFGRSDYHALTQSNPAYYSYLTTLFSTKAMLFLGFSLTDPDLRTLLSELRAALEDYAGPHYALVSGVDPIEQGFFRNRRNIQIIPYTPSAPDHPELEEFLSALSQHVREGTGDAKMPMSAERPARLKSVRLENIGPFDELKIELSPCWNVLLGENGVGKSTILRAIAFCLCGRDAQTYIGRLIKSGEDNGSIELENAQGDKYLARLRRTGGRTEVISSPEYPLEALGCLALGFPPLRSVGWRQPEGVELTKSSRQPGPADLLPILSNDPDPRISDLKQWIINLDYLISKESDVHDAELLKDFFGTIDSLTEGMKLRFAEVNPKTLQITVITDDGPVPIEIISQGTQSLIGWLGVLLRRLYEVYFDTERPKEQYALVLIDEIDAHMHPRWQMRIVSSLRHIFPGVQFVATTHNPLCLRGTQEGEAVVMKRHGANIAAITDLPPVEGLWVDQLLTSEHFGLNSTLDPELESKFQEYYRLLALHQPTDEDRRKIEKLKSELDKYKALGTTRRERLMLEAVDEQLAQELETFDPEKRQKLKDETRQKVAEIWNKTLKSE